MSVTEVSSQSWISRLGGSIKGIFFGFIMIIGGIALLWWNEGNVVHTRKALNNAEGLCVSISPDEIDPNNENKVVHLTGMAIGQELEDPEFGVSVEGIKLTREVEMYQWVEKTDTKKRKKIGGGEETTKTYTYAKEWKSSPVNSGNFKEEGHNNPGAFPMEAESINADDVKLGAFDLGDLSRSIGGAIPVKIEKLDSSNHSSYVLENGVAYKGSGSMGSPRIGDFKVSYEYVANKEVSVVSKQVGASFEAYQDANGKEVEMLRTGKVSAKDMFEGAQKQATMMMWIWRVLGYFLISGGFGAIFKPLSIIGDVIPFVGGSIGAATGLVAGILAAIITLITVALAWIIYRPLLGVGLLIVAGGLIYLIVMWNKKRKAKKKAEVAV